MDGNKRIALASGLTFLTRNGLWEVEKLPVDDWEALPLDVGASRLDRDATTKQLKALVKKKPGKKLPRKR